eukprot:5320433-Prymnesium_polylepis.1
MSERPKVVLAQKAHHALGPPERRRTGTQRVKRRTLVLQQRGLKKAPDRGDEAPRRCVPPLSHHRGSELSVLPSTEAAVALERGVRHGVIRRVAPSPPRPRIARWVAISVARYAARRELSPCVLLREHDDVLVDRGALLQVVHRAPLKVGKRVGAIGRGQPSQLAEAKERRVCARRR